MLVAAALTSLPLLVRCRATSRRAKRALTTLRFDWTADEIAANTSRLVAQFAAVDDAVAAGPPTFDSAIKPLLDAESDLSTIASSCTFVAHVSADSRLRDAGVAAEQVLSEAAVARDTRKDVYTVVKAFSESPECQALANAEHKRFVDRVVRDFERNGVHLAAEVAAAVKANKERMSALSIEFHKHTNDENTILEFGEEELAGLPADFISGLERAAGNKLKVSLKYPHYMPIMDQCSVPATRQRMEAAFNQRCVAENVPIMQELVRLRHETALLMGHATHSDYVLSIRMAQSSAAVLEFLRDLNEKLTPLARQEMAELVALKVAEEGEADPVIRMWDFRYYLDKHTTQAYQVDMEEVKQYFPMSVVLPGMLGIYEELLGLTFRRVDNPHVWHEDVAMYAVHDSDAAGAARGHFYLDLHPREGKFGHAACFPLQARCELSDGSQQLPAAACVCNFSRGNLGHSEVVTLFHEFGHCLHNICSEATVERFAGTSVERDFVEAPSQMLENWCFEPEALARMSGKGGDTNQPLPEELARKLEATKVAHAGLLSKRQLLFGLLDQTIHAQPDADFEQVLEDLHRDVAGIPRTPGTNMLGSFGHLAGGYDAQYYGYMWSDVFAADMFSQFKAEGIFNKETGKRYRQCIISRGGSVDAADMLRNFLGRDPTKDAFLKQLGL